MRKSCFWFALMLLLSFSGFAQQQSNLYEEDVPIIYMRQAAGGVTIHSHGGMLDGYLGGFDFRKGKRVTGYKIRVWETEFVKIQHPKEFKAKVYEDGKEYVYGKLNQFFIIRSGIGYQNTIYGKGDRAGVEVRFNYSAGISLGLTKPVYLNIIETKGVYSTEITLKRQKYDPQKHFVDNIYGQAEFQYGLNEIKPHPGGYGKIGVSFENSSSDNDIRALETGVVVDAFPTTIPIMALTKNYPVYFSLYLTVLFGGKW